MCKEGVDIIFCTLGQHEAGEIVRRRYKCHAAESVDFGDCGKVTRAKPGHFFTQCDACLADRREKRANSRAESRAVSRAASRPTSRAASRLVSRLPTRANTPTTRAGTPTTRADIPSKKAEASITEDSDLPVLDDDDAQSTY